jgi:hypothetical protein
LSRSHEEALELVAKIKALEQDVLDSVKLGFDNDVAWIKVVNLEVDLVTTQAQGWC